MNGELMRATDVDRCDVHTLVTHPVRTNMTRRQIAATMKRQGCRLPRKVKKAFLRHRIHRVKSGVMGAYAEPPTIKLVK
jgi:hypothetical protein